MADVEIRMYDGSCQDCVEKVVILTVHPVMIMSVQSYFVCLKVRLIFIYIPFEILEVKVCKYANTTLVFMFFYVINSGVKAAFYFLLF